MSGVQLASTTDSAEAVTAALGDLAKKETIVENKSAPAADAASETAEHSEAHDDDKGHEADADESGESDESKPNDGEDKPKKKNGFKKRIDKLNLRVAEEQREKEYWRAEAEKSRSSKETQPNQAANKAAAIDSDAKPKSDDFESHAAFVEALTDWKVEQKDKARDLKQRDAEVKTGFDKQVESHLDRVKSFKQSTKDFDEVIKDADDIRISPTVRQVILESDNGPELMYALAQNRDEYERICGFQEKKALRELGKFEARFIKTADSSEEKKQVTSKAPTPIKPVGSKASSTKSPDEMSFQEFKKWRAAGGGA